VNALEVVIADFITRKLGGAGNVTQCELGQEDFEITLQLEGQPDPVTLNVKGITWSVQETTFILHCQTVHCSLPWLETLIQNWLRDHQQQVRWPDHIKFIPLKLKLRKAA
jgi:hypothetical protein